MSHDENVENKDNLIELNDKLVEIPLSTEINLLKELLCLDSDLIGCYQVHRLLTKKLETSNVDFKKSDLMYVVYVFKGRTAHARLKGELKENFRTSSKRKQTNKTA